MSSKKEEQRKIKEEKQASSQRQERLTGWLLKGGVAVLVLLAAIVFYEGLFLAPQSPPPGQVAAEDHVRGNTDAAHTLTVYADFQCPACMTETNLIARAWPQIGDRTKLVFRHYPLDTHRHSFIAARYAEAAARQDAFWPMHDVLYANQGVWSTLEDATAMFDSYATDLGLDVMQLKQEVELPEVRDKIFGDQRGGTRAGVRSTPTLFIDGSQVLRNPGSVSELVRLIGDASGD
jgi:protein-disulfide isomerase